MKELVREPRCAAPTTSTRRSRSTSAPATTGPKPGRPGCRLAPLRRTAVSRGVSFAGASGSGAVLSQTGVVGGGYPHYTPGRFGNQRSHAAGTRRLGRRPRRRADPRLRVDLPRDQRGGGRARHRRAGRQGRGARRHRLQVGGRHPGRRAVDPALGQPGRRGFARRRDRRARAHEGGRRRPADPVEEARPLRARLEEHRARRRVGRAGRRARDRGRQGRPDPRPRRARLPAGVARRHPPRPGSRRVPRPGAPLQGDRAQPLAQQRRALAPRRARGGAQGAAPADPRPPPAGRRRRGARSRTSSTSARSSTSTAWTA